MPCPRHRAAQCSSDHIGAPPGMSLEMSLVLLEGGTTKFETWMGDGTTGHALLFVLGVRMYSFASCGATVALIWPVASGSAWPAHTSHTPTTALGSSCTLTKRQRMSPATAPRFQSATATRPPERGAAQAYKPRKSEVVRGQEEGKKRHSERGAAMRKDHQWPSEAIGAPAAPKGRAASPRPDDQMYRGCLD